MKAFGYQYLSVLCSHAQHNPEHQPALPNATTTSGPAEINADDARLMTEGLQVLQRSLSHFKRKI